MVNIVIYRKNGALHGFEVEGHTGFAEAGSDIVCAGISAITQTAIIGLIEVLNVDVKLAQKKGYLTCVLPEGLNEETKEKTSIVLETMVLGLKKIEDNYGDFLVIEEKEK